MGSAASRKDASPRDRRQNRRRERRTAPLGQSLTSQCARLAVAVAPTSQTPAMTRTGRESYRAVVLLAVAQLFPLTAFASSSGRRTPLPRALTMAAGDSRRPAPSPARRLIGEEASVGVATAGGSCVGAASCAPGPPERQPAPAAGAWSSTAPFSSSFCGSTAHPAHSPSCGSPRREPLRRSPRLGPHRGQADPSRSRRGFCLATPGRLLPGSGELVGSSTGVPVEARQANGPRDRPAASCPVRPDRPMMPPHARNTT
jgi:hypothetical protein